MDRNRSILFTKELASRVAANALYTPYPEELSGSAAVEYVIERLSEALLLKDRAGEKYIRLLKEHARELDPKTLTDDLYIRTVRFEEAKCGAFQLKYGMYERGELLQYAMPTLSAEIVTPELAFYSAPVQFPAIYEGNTPWVSVCPSEISSMRKPIETARGRVLTLGCGLGYYPFMVSLKEEVTKVTIVERQPEVIQLFKEHILPYFPNASKIEVIQADAFEFVENMPTDAYDFCFADIWEGTEDGATAYLKLKESAKRCGSTEFTYWIEDEIRWWLMEMFSA